MRRRLSHVVPALSVAGTLIAISALLAMVAVDEGSAEVASQGQLAIQAEATLSGASGVRNGTTQAMLLVESVELGEIEQSSRESALGELDATVDEFTARSSQLVAKLPDNEASEIAGLSRAFLTTTESVLGQLRTGDSQIATRNGDSEAQEAYERLVTAVVRIRDDTITRVLIPAESVGRFADAVRFLVVFVIPVGALLAFRRATRRRREREELEAQLVTQTEISAARNEFIANLSHELRTPLTGIYGFALTLDETGVSDQQTAEELIGLIVSEASELSRMVDDLIAAGRLEAEEMVYDIEDVDLVAELDQVLEPFQRRGTEISVDTEATQIRADRLRLRQIVRNLVSNACKHGGEHITIETSTDESTIVIQVIDNGPGVSADVQQRLFDRYVHEGTGPLLAGSVGLGLAIARSLATGMGGTLEYRRDNDLTRFELRLPAVAIHRSLDMLDNAHQGR